MRRCAGAQVMSRHSTTSVAPGIEIRTPGAYNENPPLSEGELRKRNRSQLGVWASQRYDRECALVVSPEHPHYRGGVTPGVLRRRAGPSGGLPPPGAAPLMRDLSRTYIEWPTRRERRRRIDACERPRGALTWSHTLHRGNINGQGRADMRERRCAAGRKNYRCTGQ